MDSAAEEEVPGPQGRVAARLFGVLSGFIPSEALSFGGGTVLAARWNHRRSLDVDPFCEPTAYDVLGPAGRARLEAAIKTIPGCAEEPARCDSIATYAEIDGLEATLLPRTVGIGSACPTRLAGTGLVLQSSAQILYAKVAKRMYAGAKLSCATPMTLPARSTSIHPRSFHRHGVARTNPLPPYVDTRLFPSPTYPQAKSAAAHVIFSSLLAASIPGRSMSFGRSFA